MRSWSVSARGLPAVQVRSANWIVALGTGLEQLGRAAALSRLACEVLPNGTVIARDVSTGTGYVIQEVDPDDHRDNGHDVDRSEDVEALPADALEILSDEDTLDPIGAADTTLTACQIALTIAREQVVAESGAVILEEKGYLRFSAAAGPHARKLIGVRLPLGTGVAGFSMEKRRTIVLTDAHDDPRHCGEVDALTGYTTREIVVIPVSHVDRVYGVIELMNLPEGRRFTNAEVKELTAVAMALGERLARG